ncbi:DUF5602 domain-containing protein [Sunxiuqinia rutila]|uniref:DUF5602 domain-containing protein n=1 Tax=Sunxiuqinia rutila TaxID=1397841 RepID=UPI003D35ABE2
MKKKLNIGMLVLAITVLLGLASCQKDDWIDSSELKNASGLSLKNATMNTFYSSTQPLGRGTARAWVRVNKEGDPLAVGVDLSEKALMGLPDEMVQLVLKLPKTKGHQFYTHALVDWNPEGHEPPGIYDTPHFDFHFYTLGNEARMAIPAMDPPYEDLKPAAMYVPENYMELPGLVPGMGAHWVDVTSPELSGVPFTYTFIWGSYQGHFIFWEPMITRAYLMSMPDDLIPIPQPEAYEMAGWYATDYSIRFSEKPNQYTVALENLMYHDAE